MLVELDIYSGRPNPHWSLDEHCKAIVEQLLSSLAPAAVGGVRSDALGYRGFAFHAHIGLCRVYRGTVATPQAWYADPDCSIETFLIEHMPGELVALQAIVAAELKARDPK